MGLKGGHLCSASSTALRSPLSGKVKLLSPCGGEGFSEKQM